MKKIKKILVLPVIVSSAFLFSLDNYVFSASNTNFVNYSNSENISLKNESISITKSGIYNISGTLSDGMILVDVGEKENVVLNLSSVNITNKTGSAIFIKSGKATINLSGKNFLTDGSEYKNIVLDENATISAVEDLIIDGNGALTINANYNDAINTKDDLIIKNGNFVINAKDDGIRAKDSLTIENGNFEITASGDALKSDNENKGYITINGGKLNISAGSDGMQAYNELKINSGEINILKSLEGLESQIITINGGKISVKASDDGLNASDSGATEENAPGQANEKLKIVINGGELIVDSEGDGIDSNGNIEMNGGKVLVYGTTKASNSAVDYDGKFAMNSGEILAFGISGMAQNASDISKQNSVLLTLSGDQVEGSKFTVKDSSGNTVLEEISKKSFNAVMFSNSNLKNGTYIYEINNKKIGEFTISSIITGNGFGGFGGFNPQMRGNFGNGQMPFPSQNGQTPPNFGRNFDRNINPELQNKVNIALEKIFEIYKNNDKQSRNKIFDNLIERVKKMDISSFDENKKTIVFLLISGLENLKNRN